ncbi:MAG: LuxR C-terminal-related transcriptional regulator [Acidimicrobiia bacterium]|nr:LuxR C-terminal-related transcriptional regulator [Acidimicrobiia bacterium]
MAETTTPGAGGIDNRSPVRLLERSAELDLLDHCLEGARRGAGGTVMICGAAGLGKTSLVQTFLAAEHAEPPTILHGGCDDLLAPRSFGPFRDMAQSSGLLPDEVVSGPNREDLLSALTAILDRPSRPAVVVIEDAHWADDASIDVMRYLARRIVTMHAMMVITLRDEEITRTHPVRRLLTGPTSCAPIRIDLAPLSPGAVADLARNSPLDPGHLHSVTGGNPFLVRELLTADHEDAARSARATLVARAERLSAEGRAVLLMLSVLPEGVDAAAARVLFGDAADALHEAERSGLLVSTADRIRFRHELGRNAVMSSMSFSERMEATNKVLSALLEVGADPTSLVHISRAAGDARRATRFALEVLEDGLAPNNHREAWRLTRIALECTTELSAREIATLHEQAARAGQVTNNHAEAVVHAEKAVAVLTDDGADDHTLASALLTLATTRRLVGDRQRSTEAIRQAQELLSDDSASKEWVACNTMLAGAAFLDGDLDRSIDLAAESVAVAEANEMMHELVHGLGLRAIATNVCTSEGEQDMNRAIELGAVHGPPERHAANLYNYSVQCRLAADIERAEHYIDESERFANDHGLDNIVFHARVQRAHILIQRGRTDEAETVINDCLAEAVDPGAIKTSADAALARIWTRRGDPRAAELVERSWSEALDTGESQKIAVAGITRLEHLWLQGDDEALLEAARNLAEFGLRHRHHRLRAEALRHLMRLGEKVEPFEHCPPPLAAALAGNHRRAAELWDEAGQPYERALELLESTDASIAFEGLRLLDRTGATRTADLIRHRLRRRGFQSVPRGPRKSAEGAMPVLTDRQIDVLKLIAKGLTNSEIADELFVARRTVDNHVSAILSRLGVEGRHEAVTEAVSRGMLDCAKASAGG